MADSEDLADWTPKIRRITAPNVGEKGKLTFIRSLVSERRFDEATDELQALLDDNPRSYLGNIQMGRMMERNGQFDRAVEHFETAHAANPAQAEAPLLAGTSYFRLKDYDRARTSFQTALELDPKRASAHLGLAQVHFRNDEFDQAKARLGQALAFDPQLQPARALLARIHNRQGDTGETKHAIEDLLSTRPDQLRPTVALARIHLKDEQPAEAIKLLEAATGTHEKNGQLWALLGRAKLSVADWKGAEIALRRALAIDPRQRELVPHLVDALIPQDKLAEARATLDRLPDAARRSARVHAGYGKIHMAAGNYKQAAEAFRAALLRKQDTAAADGEADDEHVVAVEQVAAPANGDWKEVAERYQTNLHDARRPPAAGEERGARRRSRATRRRQEARAAKA